jgi:hypothetical protein
MTASETSPIFEWSISPLIGGRALEMTPPMRGDDSALT